MNPVLVSVFLFCGLSFFAVTMFGRMAGFRSLAKEPVDRTHRLPERLKALLRFGLGQRRMVDREEFVPGLMHVLIFGAFLTVQARTLMLFVMAYSGDAAHTLMDLGAPFWAGAPTLLGAYKGYLFLKDIIARLSVLAVGYYFWLRLVVKPVRLTQSGEALLILGFIGGLMVTEFVFGASHLRQLGIGWSSWEPVTSLVGAGLSFVDPGLLHGLGVFSFWTHLLIVVTFLNFLPYGKHFHVIVGLPNVFLRALPPEGNPALSSSAKLPTPNLEKEEFGAKVATQLSWKQGLDVNTCTECGRCQTHCPTYITQKPLTHKAVNQAIKHFLWDHQQQLPTVKKTEDGRFLWSDLQGAEVDMPPLVASEGGVLKPEQCGPVPPAGGADSLPGLHRERAPPHRHAPVQGQVGRFPQSCSASSKASSDGEIPGASANTSATNGARPVAQVGRRRHYEYLFYVGCAGSTTSV